MISFVEISNFMSFEKSKVTFNDSDKFILITGYNYDENCENGAGKSALIASIFWALTGEQYRTSKQKLNLNDLIKIGKKSMYVKLGLKNGYVIERYRKDKKYNNNVIVKKNDKIISDLDVIRTNKLIEKILNTTKNELFNLHVFYPDNYKDFFSLSNEEKNKLLEKIICLNIFSTDFIKSVREKYSDTNNEINNLLMLINEKKSVIENLKELLEKKKSVEENLNLQKKKLLLEKEKIETRMAENNSKIKELASGQIKIKEIAKKIKEKYEKIEKINDLIYKQIVKFHSKKKVLEDEIKKIVNEIDNIEKRKTKTTCPFCFQPINNEYIDKAINDKKDNLENVKNKVDKLKKYISILSNKRNKYQTKITILAKDIDKIEKNYFKIKTNIEVLKSNNASLIAREGDINIELKNIEKNIVKLNNLNEKQILKKEKEIEEIKEKIGQLEEDKNILSIWLEIISQKSPFRKYVFRQIIEIMSDLTSFYFKQLWSDDYYVRWIYEKKGLDCEILTPYGKKKYGHLSSGEKRVLDISITLAFISILNSNKKFCGFLFLDEIVDKLSKNVIIKVMEILKDFANKTETQLFFISHNAYVLSEKEMFDKVIFIEKIDNKSVIKK